MERKVGQHRFAAALALSVALTASAWSQGSRASSTASITSIPPTVSPVATDVASAEQAATSPSASASMWSGGFEFGGHARSGDGLDARPSPSTSAVSIQVLGTEQTTSLPPVTPPPANAPNAVPSPTNPPTTLPPTTLPPTTLPPTTLPPTTETTSTPEERGRQALGRISYDWVGRLPGWSITFAPGRAGVMGYTYVDEQRIEVFVRDDMSDALLAHVVAHELGHAVDVSLNSGDDRAAWASARGIETVQWWPGSGVTDFSTGAGDFAEAFAVWQVGAANFRGRAAGPPTSDQLALLASLANG